MTTVIEAIQSSRHPRIVVIDAGHPVFAAKVEIFRTELHGGNRELPILRLKTDRRGVTLIPTLAPGYYDVEISLGPCRSDSLALLIRPSGKGTAVLTRELITLEESASGMPCQPVVACPGMAMTVAVTGNVTDVTGAAISDARISIERILDSGNRCGVLGRTGQDGRFLVMVPPGVYRLRVEEPGFRPSEMPLQVERDKQSQELHIHLVIGAT